MTRCVRHIYNGDMSYDIELCDPITKKPIEFETPHHMTGGTYQQGGTTQAWLNVTYNYTKFYDSAMSEEKGIRVIYGMSGAESIPILKAAISKLGNDIDDDYWKPTEGNAKRALIQLLAFAQMRPDGIWTGD